MIACSGALTFIAVWPCCSPSTLACSCQGLLVGDGEEAASEEDIPSLEAAPTNQLVTHTHHLKSGLILLCLTNPFPT